MRVKSAPRKKYVLMFEHRLTPEMVEEIRREFKDFVDSPEQRVALMDMGGRVVEINGASVARPAPSRPRDPGRPRAQ